MLCCIGIFVLPEALNQQLVLKPLNVDTISFKYYISLTKVLFKILSFIQQNWRFTSDRLRFSFWNTQAGLFQHKQHENERPTFLFIPMSDITKYFISIPWTT